MFSILHDPSSFQYHLVTQMYYFREKGHDLLRNCTITNENLKQKGILNGCSDGLFSMNSTFLIRFLLKRFQNRREYKPFLGSFPLADTKT